MKKLFAAITLVTFLMFGAFSMQAVMSGNFGQEIVNVDKTPDKDKDKKKSKKEEACKDSKDSKEKCREVTSKCCHKATLKTDCKKEKTKKDDGEK
ncbi:MAG: hypothetical protein R6T99_05575 [Bacteroidales bacterium]